MPQRHQVSTMIKFTIENVFETLLTAYVGMSIDHSMIDPIVNINLGNIFQHLNGSK